MTAFIRNLDAERMSPSENAMDDSDNNGEDMVDQRKEQLLNGVPAPEYLAQDGLSTYREREQQQQQQEQKAQDSDNDDNEAQVGRLIGASEAYFCESQYDMRMLFAIAYGIKDKYGRVIADWKGQPYFSVKKKKLKNIQANKRTTLDEN